MPESASDRQQDRGLLPRRLAATLISQILLPVGIGLVTGCCVAGASTLIEDWWLTQLASLPGSLPALFSPLALILTWAVTRWITRVESPGTSELYIRTFHTPGAWVPLAQMPGRLLAAAATVAFGGSQGFESASVLIGASWSGFANRWLRLQVNEDQRRTLLASGASAGIAAVFSSPALGALYGIEIPFKRDVDAPRLAPCALAAVASFVMRDLLVGRNELVPMPDPPTFDLRFLLAVAAVAIACGMGARLFALAEEQLHALARLLSRGLRAVVGGLILAGLAWAGHALTGQWITFGPGYLAADWVQSQSHPLMLLVLACLIRVSGNLVSVFGGGGGGVFTSLACNGVFFGQIIAEWTGCGQTRLLALLGAACFLGGGYRLPLACMLYVAEASGSLPATACGLAGLAVGQVLMGEKSVSEAQHEEREISLGE